MPAPKPLLDLLREWVVKAESDLSAGALLLRSGRRCPADAVCFHAQQCVEKYLKALLTLQGVPFPKTHAINELVFLTPQAIRAPISLTEQATLTAYAAATRYPGTYGAIGLGQARASIKLARRVRSHVRKLLPRAALPKGGK